MDKELFPALYAAGEEVGALLKERGETVAVAESSAGGLIASALLAVPGASAYFRGGAVIYTAKSIHVLMGMSLKDLMKQGIRSSSEGFAEKLALRIREMHTSGWGISETGAAGPGNGYGDPAGHTCMAVADKDGVKTIKTLRTGKDERGDNMVRFATEVLQMFAEQLRAAD